MNDIDKLAEGLRSQITDTSESPETTNLHLTREGFIALMLHERDGRALLDLMEKGEWRVCERMGLTNAYNMDGVSYIDVPRWNNLVAHLRIVSGI